jgi:hypothetical protein
MTIQETDYVRACSDTTCSATPPNSVDSTDAAHDIAVHRLRQLTPHSKIASILGRLGHRIDRSNRRKRMSERRPTKRMPRRFVGLPSSRLRCAHHPRRLRHRLLALSQVLQDRQLLRVRSSSRSVRRAAARPIPSSANATRVCSRAGAAHQPCRVFGSFPVGGEPLCAQCYHHARRPNFAG